MTEWFDEDRSVAMVRYECCQCDMTATCVVTESSSRAWSDHMANHPDTRGFMAWSWTAVELPFGPTR
jgi:hypothetical protein